MQVPWIAATTGLVARSTSRIRLSRLGSATALGEPNSLMSAPPENTRPAPAMTIAAICGSASAACTCAASARRVSRPRPLTGGLSSVMTATRPWRAREAVMEAISIQSRG